MTEETTKSHEEWFRQAPPERQPEMTYAMARAQGRWAIGRQLTESQWREACAKAAGQTFGDATRTAKTVRTIEPAAPAAKE